MDTEKPPGIFSRLTTKRVPITQIDVQFRTMKAVESISGKLTCLLVIVIGGIALSLLAVFLGL